MERYELHQAANLRPFGAEGGIIRLDSQGGAKISALEDLVQPGCLLPALLALVEQGDTGGIGAVKGFQPAVLLPLFSASAAQCAWEKKDVEVPCPTVLSCQPCTKQSCEQGDC